MSWVLRFSRKPAASGFCRLALVVGISPGVRLFGMRSFGVVGGGVDNRAFMQERFCRSVFAGAFKLEFFVLLF